MESHQYIYMVCDPETVLYFTEVHWLSCDEVLKEL